MVKELGPREWSPRSKKDRERGEVEIKVLGNLGDASPFDYGGLIVYRVRDPGKTGPEASWIQAEFWHEPMEEQPDRYDVYRWQIAYDAMKDLSWVDNWKEISEFVGVSLEELKKQSQSGNPLDRAGVYRAVADYHGFENLDSYPEKYTREEMEKRWPEFA
jgi:hypothetical protein